jgi:hypothetical protein
MRECPYIVKKPVDGDHFARRIEIVELPNVTECVLILILWPHAVSHECMFADIDSMLRELFFQKVNDSFSLGENYKVKTYFEENKHPLQDLFADEDDGDSVLKVHAFFAQAIGADVNSFGWEAAMKTWDYIFVPLVDAKPAVLSADGRLTKYVPIAFHSIPAIIVRGRLVGS